jgi:hypothetical protein
VRLPADGEGLPEDLEAEVHRWRFAEVEGVAPDNHAADRALRHGVIRRKLASDHTTSTPGERATCTRLYVAGAATSGLLGSGERDTRSDEGPFRRILRRYASSRSPSSPPSLQEEPTRPAWGRM